MKSALVPASFAAMFALLIDLGKRKRLGRAILRAGRSVLSDESRPCVVGCVRRIARGRHEPQGRAWGSLVPWRCG